MKFLLFIYFILYTTSLLANTSAPFPLFLKTGFSSVIEFNAIPSQVVLGDTKSFQVERLNKSLAIRSNTSEATSNLFVYFNNQEPYIFTLTSSDEAEPTFYKKFDFPDVQKKSNPQVTIPIKKVATTRVLSAVFDRKKDALNIEIILAAPSKSKVSPEWEKTRLKVGKQEIKPNELWSEREVVQKDSSVKARFQFLKPDIPRNLGQSILNLYTKESKKPIQLKVIARSK